MHGQMPVKQFITKSAQELVLAFLEFINEMNDNSIVLNLESIDLHFGGLQVLKKIDIAVGANEVVGLIGPNGAGKTSLFNTISGIVKPNSGKFILNGAERSFPKTHELAKLGIARTLQGVGLFGDLTVIENIMISAAAHSKSQLLSAFLGRNHHQEEELRSKSLQALERVYAANLASRRADTLTYPDAKRVALARALVLNPKLLLLDEPAGGLGANDIRWMNELILQLKSQMSILIVEHHMDVVMTVCDRVYVLNFGEIIASGDSESVRKNPAVISAYLGTSAA